MHRRIVVTLAILALSVSCLAGCKKQEPQKAAETPAPAVPATQAPAVPAAPAAPTGATGEALFKQYCAACHPEGGNPMNPKKTLHAADMAANNVKTAQDVVNLIRNPGKGMTKFDPATISDEDAMKIAEYTLATFK